MLDMPIDSITEADLQRLVDERVTERKVLDYKAHLPGNSDRDKKEFLADVSSFANSAGGHLIYGIVATKGLPTSLSGITGIHSDDEILRLENIARDGLDPRVPQLQTGAASLVSGSHAVIMRIPRSWAGPHLVKFLGSSRFYARNSAGKYQMDVQEIRAAFSSSDSLAERMREFRANRLKAIVSRVTPVALRTGGVVVLQVLPLGAFDVGVSRDLSALDSTHLRPMSTSGWSYRINFDGVLAYSSNGQGKYTTYVQVYRSGIIEAVETRILGREGSDTPTIPSTYFEREIIESCRTYLGALRRIGVDGPAFIVLSLVGVQGYIMGVSSHSFPEDQNPIDRNVLEVPEVLVEDLERDPAPALRPAFDAIWNAAGWRGSTNYDDAGNWTGGR